MRVVSRTAIRAGVHRYERWRHGGWYVLDIRYPSGACGCVSRNYSDRKWRIVAETNVSAADFPTVRTFPTRDAAADAEQVLAASRRVE